MSALDDITVDRLLADLANAGARDRVSIAAAAERIAQEDTRPPVSLRDMLDELQAAQPDRLEWPEGWFGGIDPGDVAACQRLWSASLLSCIRSVVGLLPDDHNGSGHGEKVAGHWIGSRDFHMMCALAGFDGVAVYERLKRLPHDTAMQRALLGERASNNAEARK